MDSLVDKLESKRALSVKYARLAELSIEKKAECREEIVAIKPKLATLLVQIKQLQKHVSFVGLKFYFRFIFTIMKPE